MSSDAQVSTGSPGQDHRAADPTLTLWRPGRAIEHRQRRGEDAYGSALAEVLEHLRMPYQLQDADTPDPGGADVLLVVDAGEIGEPDAGLRSWVEAGGQLVIATHGAGWDDLAGVRTGTPVDSELIAVGPLPGAIGPTADRALRGIGGHRLEPAGADVAMRATWADGSAAIIERGLGAGRVISFGVDLPQTLVRIRQGFPVTADGRPAADGTAPIDDGILKCEDGLGLSLDHDRRWPPGVEPEPGPYPYGRIPPAPTPVFDLPHADWWWIVLADILISAADRAGAGIAWLDYWPDRLPAIGHLSHDADLNEDEDAEAALAAFAKAGIRVTWCQLYPGSYDPGIYRRITAAGHEHALHYNAMPEGDITSWGRRQFLAQLAWVRAITDTDDIVGNKNHYTRWEGWTEFYDWCVEAGIRIDESRGSSKVGDVGFTFGNAHPYFPIGDAGSGNRCYPVLSLPLHTQDLALAAHESCRDVILDGALAVNGVAHFLFHGPHLRARPDTAAAFERLIRAVRDRGMRWWTAGRIDAWERARRTVELSVRQDGSGATVVARSAAALAGATILVRLPGVDAAEVSGDADLLPVRRHGRDYLGLCVDLEPGVQQWSLRW